MLAEALRAQAVLAAENVLLDERFRITNSYALAHQASLPNYREWYLHCLSLLLSQIVVDGRHPRLMLEVTIWAGQMRQEILKACPCAVPGMCEGLRILLGFIDLTRKEGNLQDITFRRLLRPV